MHICMHMPNVLFYPRSILFMYVPHADACACACIEEYEDLTDLASATDKQYMAAAPATGEHVEDELSTHGCHHDD